MGIINQHVKEIHYISLTCWLISRFLSKSEPMIIKFLSKSESMMIRFLSKSESISAL